MHLRACRVSIVCPACQTISSRVHSRYARELGDLPWEGVLVRIYLQTRKFFCGGRDCRRGIFTERLPNTVLRYARRTRRSSEAQYWITLALGGAAGSRLALRMGLWSMARHCGGRCGDDPDPARHYALRAFSASTIGPGARDIAMAPSCRPGIASRGRSFARPGTRDRSRVVAHAWVCGDRQQGPCQRLCRSSTQRCR
jgi:hypothetical protein